MKVFTLPLNVLQVNGMDTVRVPMSLLPYEDLSATHQKRLKAQRKLQAVEHESLAVAEDDGVLKAVSDAEDGKDSPAAEAQQESIPPSNENSDKK